MPAHMQEITRASPRSHEFATWVHLFISSPRLAAASPVEAMKPAEAASRDSHEGELLALALALAFGFFCSLSALRRGDLGELV